MRDQWFNRLACCTFHSCNLSRRDTLSSHANAIPQAAVAPSVSLLPLEYPSFPVLAIKLGATSTSMVVALCDDEF